MISRIYKTTAWLLLLVSTSLLYFKIPLIGDSLFLESVYRDLFVYSGHWTAWRFTPAPAYVPDVLLYFIYSAFFKFPINRIFLVILSQAILIALSGIWLVRSIAGKLHWLTHVLIVSGVALISLVVARTDKFTVYLYFNSTNDHLCSVIIGILALSCMLTYLQQSFSSRGFSWLALLIVLTIAGIISDRLFVIIFWLISIISCILAYIWHSWICKQRVYGWLYIKLITTLLIGYLGFLIINPLVTYNEAFSSRTTIDPEAANHSLVTFLKTAPYIINNLDWTFYIIATLFILGTLIAISLLIPYKISTEKPVIGWDIETALNSKTLMCFASIFLILLIPINFVSVILSGSYNDPQAYRYLEFPITIGIFLFFSYFNAITVNKINKYHWCIIAGIVLSFLVIVNLLTWAKQKNYISNIKLVREYGPSDSYADLPTTSPPIQLARCLDLFIKKYYLKDGAGMYGDARVASLMTHANIWVNAFLSNGLPFYWMNSKQQYYQANGHKIYYNFVILNNNDSASFTASSIGKALPKPSKILTCKNTNGYEIWLYNKGSLDTFLKKNTEQYFNTIPK